MRQAPKNRQPDRLSGKAADVVVVAVGDTAPLKSPIAFDDMGRGDPDFSFMATFTVTGTLVVHVDYADSVSSSASRSRVSMEAA